MINNVFKNIVLVDTPLTAKKRTPKNLNPDGMAVRIFANGQVFPSANLVEKFNLEFREKSTEENPVDQGMGFDVVDSSEWAPTKEYPRNILFGVVSKTLPKVDLFASYKRGADGKPTATVLTQGVVCATLLDLARSMGYMKTEDKYCDLILDINTPINTKDNISHIPKIIEKGERKGERETVRREYSTYYLAVDAAVLAEQEENQVEEISQPN